MGERRIVEARRRIRAMIRAMRTPVPLAVAVVLLATPLRADPLDATDDVTDAAVWDDIAIAAQPPPITPAIIPATPQPPTPVPAEAALDVASYTLRATLDPRAHEVTGEGTLRWRNTSRVAVRELWWHLYLNGFESERTVFLRTTGGEHRGNTRGRYGRIDLRTMRLDTGEDLLATAEREPTVRGDRSELRVTLPRAVGPGEEVTVSLAWTSVLPEVFARTGFKGSFHMVAQWFPKVAVLEADGRWAHFPFHGNSEFYADFGRYDVTVTVPRGYVVGATGTPGAVEHTPAGERHRFTASPVHDFAFTAWDRFRERRGEAGDVALRVLFPPGYDEAARVSIAALQRALPAYEQRFGTYPYPGLTVVLPPEEAEGAGGMEYPTLITTASVPLWVPGAARALEHVTLHEFMHQYFYGLVASNENAWPFLDEGFTEYATALGLDDLHPRGGSMFDLPAMGLHLDAFAVESFWSAGIRHVLPVAQGADAFPTFGSYGGHVYPRTATVLRTAERTVGALRFRQALRAYATAWRFRHPTPDDFFAVMRRELGDPIVDDLLRPALTAPLALDYAVTDATSQREGGRYVGHVTVHRTGTVTLPVEVLLEDARGARRTVTWDGQGGWTSIPYDGEVALRSARVDPWGRVPLDQNRANNALLASGQRGPGTLPMVARVAYWLGLALGAVAQ
jgi:hypothetical protein